MRARSLSFIGIMMRGVLREMDYYDCSIEREMFFVWKH